MNEMLAAVLIVLIEGVTIVMVLWLRDRRDDRYVPPIKKYEPDGMWTWSEIKPEGRENEKT